MLTATAIAFPGHPEMVLARLLASLATAAVMGWLWLFLGRDTWLKVAKPVNAYTDALPLF